MLLFIENTFFIRPIMDAAIEQERREATVEREKLEKIEDAKLKCAIFGALAVVGLCVYVLIYIQLLNSLRGEIFSRGTIAGALGDLAYPVGYAGLLVFFVCALIAVAYALNMFYWTRKLSKTLKITIQ
jgi:mannose/fructose/N-acetylgalactosamine-specific phosphotransferase system component IID